MKRKQFTETQIITALRQNEGGSDVMEACREYGMYKATLYNWRK